MSILRNIRYNCKEATFLIEKKLVGNITLREKVQLQIHLYGCSVCKVFVKQSGMINVVIKQLLINKQQADIKLDDDFKNNLQHRIEEELNKN